MHSAITALLPSNTDAQCNYWPFAKQQRCTVQLGIALLLMGVYVLAKTSHMISIM